MNITMIVILTTMMMMIMPTFTEGARGKTIKRD